MQYRLLYLGGTSQRMTLPVLKKLHDLARAGAIIVGRQPVDSPSLSDNEKDWTAIQKSLWPGVGMRNKVGLGRVYRTMDLAQVLGMESITPDFTYIKPDQDSVVQFQHRRESDTDIYFVNNRVDHQAYTTADFRVTGKSPELWMADRGTFEPASYTIHDGVTTVPLKLEARDAVFVVFREPAKQLSRDIPAPFRTTVAEATGPWHVEFEANRGAPKSADFRSLSDWTSNTNTGIRYFSGVATYTKTVNIPASSMSSGAKMELDLGKVHDLAEVTINGKSAGVAWKPPYRVDVTEMVKPGDNSFVIKVVNLWPNRLIGDQQPGMTKVAFAPNSTYKANDPLLPSGLVGPVTLNRVDQGE